jgi:cytochrome P450
MNLIYTYIFTIQRKVQLEIENAIGHDRTPEVDDKHQMPYLQACIYECLRYQSHLPLTFRNTISYTLC